MIKQISVCKTGILMAVMALVFSLNLSFSKEAAAITIDFGGLSNGEILSNQYSAYGIYFRGQLSLSPENSPGVIDTNSVRLPSGPSLFILLTNPAYSLSFKKLEPSYEPPWTERPRTEEQPPVEEQPQEQPEQEDQDPQPEYTVYWKLFKSDGTSYEQIGSTNFGSTKDVWVQVWSFSSQPISAVEIYGVIDGNQPFYLDDLRFETSTSAVPLPATMLLLGSGLAGLAGFAGLRRKFRKN